MQSLFVFRIFLLTGFGKLKRDISVILKPDIVDSLACYFGFLSIKIDEVKRSPSRDFVQELEVNKIILPENVDKLVKSLKDIEKHETAEKINKLFKEYTSGENDSNPEAVAGE